MRSNQAPEVVFAMAKKSKSASVGALSFLVESAGREVGPVCAVVGDDGFLRHAVRKALQQHLLASEDDGELALDVVDGRTVELRDVMDELAERSLFGAACRIVVVEDADALVKQYRQQLEQYVAEPLPAAVLILELAALPGNTRLAKAIDAGGPVIRCQVPSQGRELTEFTRQLKDWLTHVARAEFECELERPAADALLELLPTEPGIVYQEVAKLSLLADQSRKIDAKLVREHVGGWRARKTWDMIDAAADGRADDALQQLDRLITAGEEPHALLPQMASTLRRFAAAVRMFQRAEHSRRSVSLRTALGEAGVPPFKLGDAERQLRQIGRGRAAQLYEWLLAADLELKGHNSTKDRARRVLETLIAKLSVQAAPERAGG